MQIKLEPGQSVLINGASGGVGSFAVQIAKVLGAKITATCGADNIEFVKSLGADQVIDYKAEDVRSLKEKFEDVYKRQLQTGAFIHRTPHQAKLLAPNISVLLINGEEDGIVKAESTQAILNNIPSRDKKLVTVPGCGHVLLGTSYLKKAIVSPVTDWLIYQTDSSQTAAIGHKQIQ